MKRIRIQKPKPRKRPNDDGASQPGGGVEEAQVHRRDLLRELDDLIHDIERVLDDS